MSINLKMERRQSNECSRIAFTTHGGSGHGISSNPRLSNSSWWWTRRC